MKTSKKNSNISNNNILETKETSFSVSMEEDNQAKIILVEILKKIWKEESMQNGSLFKKDVSQLLKKTPFTVISISKKFKTKDVKDCFIIIDKNEMEYLKIDIDYKK